MPKGKNVLAIMLGGKKPKESEDSEPEEKEDSEGGEYSEGFEESAQSAFSSLKGGDSEGFISSLKDAIITCVEDHERGGY